ncbi:MAG TPA: PfkB family carbohydrate kinase [Devosiaceae bacterium]|jgi:fructokinase|nr:PfkB family carbohydrate kinase [Devosiaceae bacterium]
MFVVGGESLIDLVSEPVGPDGVLRLAAHAGGSPYNCAIALSKLDNDTGFLCPFSTDRFGDLLLGPLAASGVHQLLGERVKAPSTLAVVTFEGINARYRFYREADRAFTREGLIRALPPAVEVFQIGGFCPILETDAAIWLEVARAAQARGALLSIDPNVRPFLVDDFDSYRARLGKFLDLAHLIKVSDEDLKWLDAGKSIEQHAADFLARPNCGLVVVTLGENGSRAFTRAGEARVGIYAPPVFGDTVGAGDCLMAGVLTALSERGALEPAALGTLDADALSGVLRYGAVVAGINCGRKGCVPPTRQEVAAVLYAVD